MGNLKQFIRWLTLGLLALSCMWPEGLMRRGTRETLAQCKREAEQCRREAEMMRQDLGVLLQMAAGQGTGPGPAESQRTANMPITAANTRWFHDARGWAMQRGNRYWHAGDITPWGIVYEIGEGWAITDLGTIYEEINDGATDL